MWGGIRGFLQERLQRWNSFSMALVYISWFQFTIACFTTYYFAWVCLKIKVQDTHQTINSQNPIHALSFSQDPNTQPWHTSLPQNKPLCTSECWCKHFHISKNKIRIHASIKSYEKSQFCECTLEFSVANLHVIMEKEEGCQHRWGSAKDFGDR